MNNISEYLKIARECDAHVKELNGFDRIVIGYALLISVYSLAIGYCAYREGDLSLLLFMLINFFMYRQMRNCLRDKHRLIQDFLNIRQKCLNEAKLLKEQL